MLDGKEKEDELTNWFANTPIIGNWRPRAPQHISAAILPWLPMSKAFCIGEAGKKAASRRNSILFRPRTRHAPAKPLRPSYSLEPRGIDLQLKEYREIHTCSEATSFASTI